MPHYVIHVLLVLLYQLADCKPVEKTDETLDNLYKIIKNENCSLDITSSVNDKKFIELCGDKSVPNLTNISEDQFLFDFQDYLCYSVYHNVRALCHSGHNQSSYTPQPFETKPDKFCTSIPEINITDKCNTWLEGDGDMGTDDCNLVTKVNVAIMNDTADLCSKECIKADKLDPMCKSLVGTSLILASVKNITVNSSKENLPPSPREIIEKKPEETKSTNKSEESSVNLPSSPREIIDKIPEESKSTIKSDVASGGKTDESKEPNNETVTKGDQQETAAGTPEAQALKEEKKEKMSSVMQEKEEDKEDKQEKKESGTDEEEEEEEEEEGDDEEDENIEEEKEASDEIVPTSVTEDLVSEPVTKSTETEEEPPPTVPRKDKAEKEQKDELPNTSFQGSIKVPSEGEGESNFFSYFMMLSLFAIVAYLVFHNKRQVGFTNYRLLERNIPHPYLYFLDHGISSGGSEAAGRPPEVGRSRIQKTGLECGGERDDLLSYSEIIEFQA